MTKQINLLRWLRTMFRGRGRMHLDSGILGEGTQALRGSLSSGLMHLDFFLSSNSGLQQTWKLLPPWASCSLPKVACKPGPGLKSTRQGEHPELPAPGNGLLSWGCCPKSWLLCISWTRGFLWGLSLGASWVCLRLGAQPSAGVKEVKGKKHTSFLTWWLKTVWPDHEESECYPGLYLCAFPVEMGALLQAEFW